MGFHLKVTIKPYHCVTCGKTYTRAKDCWIHIAMKHEQWSNEKSTKDWKRLSREKQELLEKKDCRREETEALRGQIEDQYLIGEN